MRIHAIGSKLTPAGLWAGIGGGAVAAGPRPPRAPALLSALILVASLFPAPPARGACADYLQHMRWIGGLESVEWFGDVAIRGDHAFALHSQFGLVVVDIADPTDIHAVEISPLPGHPEGIALSGDYAYVVHGAWGDGALRILDISDPLSLSTVGSLPIDDHTTGIAVQGDYAYVASLLQGLVIVDVSVPESPQVEGTLPELPPGHWWDGYAVSVRGDYAYLGCYAGLLIVDVSDPSAPWVMHTIPAEGRIAVTTTPTHAFAISDLDLVVVDVSNILLPGVVATLDMPGARGLTLAGDVLFVSRVRQGITAIDVADPGAPAVLAGVQVSAVGCGISGDHAFVGGLGGMQVVDIASLSLPEAVGGAQVQGCTRGLDVLDHHAYLTVVEGPYNGGLQVMDVSDPSAPVPAGYADVGPAECVSVAGHYAYVGQYGAVCRVDVSDPLNPILRGSAATVGTTLDIEAVGDRAYLLDAGYPLVGPALRVVDGSAADTLPIIGALELPGFPVGLEVAGDYAFVGLTDSESALVVVDVSQPAAPVIVAALPAAPAYPESYGLTASGDYLYLSRGMSADSLQVVDISNPLLPVSRGFHRLQNLVRAGGLAATGSHLYAASTDPAWVQIYSLADPVRPVPAGGMWVPGGYDYCNLGGPVVRGESVYVTVEWIGLDVLPAQCATSASAPMVRRGPRLMLAPPSPNPLTGGTEVRFHLPAGGPAGVAIFDPSGRCLRRLHDGPLGAGEHRLPWDGRDEALRVVPRGVYFVRLQWGQLEESARLIVVR